MRTHSKIAAAALAALAAAATGVSQSGAVQAAENSRADRAIAAAMSHDARTHFGAGQSFKAVDTIVDRDGTTHVRLHRSYRGLPVVGGDLVVHESKAGAWQGTSQTLAKGISLGIVPTIARATGSTLLIDATGTTPVLAIKTLQKGVQKDGTPSRLAVYRNATTGKVIRTEQEIETVGGNGQGLYSGTVPLELTQSGSSYQMKDPTRGNTYTTDMAGASDGQLCSLLGMGCKSGTLYTSPDTAFGNGTTTSGESAAVDAQYGTNETWDYYKFVHGRNGIFGTGAGSYNRVHYGKNYVNAFWDGTKMTYGDGDGVNYGPLTSLDVAGHEMSHGVTENTAGLTYSGESGGLNESTSDIFGTMVEFYASNANDPGDYLIGEEFDLKKHVGFRRMDNPASDGSSLSCWSTNAKNVDVHYSSGIGNHFFYLLSEGSGTKTIGGVVHNSPTCNGSTVTGIGHDAAAKIWYRALTVYFTSSTNYSGARAATIKAANDLYGAGSTQSNAVAAAWSAVAVS